MRGMVTMEGNILHFPKKRYMLPYPSTKKAIHKRLGDCLQKKGTTSMPIRRETSFARNATLERLAKDALGKLASEASG